MQAAVLPKMDPPSVASDTPFFLITFPVALRKVGACLCETERGKVRLSKCEALHKLKGPIMISKLSEEITMKNSVQRKQISIPKGISFQYCVGRA